MTTSWLFFEQLVYFTHETEHGSDYLAIFTQFQVDLSEVTIALKKPHKNADWKALNAYVQENLSSMENINPMTNLNNFISRLTKVVLENIKLLISIAKASLYNKRW